MFYSLLFTISLFCVSLCHADEGSDSVVIDMKRKQKSNCRKIYATCGYNSDFNRDPYWTKIRCQNDVFIVDTFRSSDGATGCDGTPSASSTLSSKINGCQCSRVGFYTVTWWTGQGCNTGEPSTVWKDRYMAFDDGKRAKERFCNVYSPGCTVTVGAGSYFVENVVGCDMYHDDEESEESDMNVQEYTDEFVAPLVQNETKMMSVVQLCSVVIPMILLVIAGLIYECCMAKNMEESECKALLSEA